MITGTGIDMIETERVGERIAKENGFKELVFSASEIEFCESKAYSAEHYAARFAGKEALLKALGAGLFTGYNLNEIEIISNESGKPEINFNGNTALKMRELGTLTIHVSMSHLKTVACAMVVIEKMEL